MTTEPVRRRPTWVGAAARLLQCLPVGRYRAMHALGAASTAPFLAELPGDLGGYLFQCDLRDPLMREVCFTGRYEPQETALLKHLLKPGMTFVDVGANWGYFTMGAAHLVGPSGRIVAVEADPRAFGALAANVARNRLAGVRLVSGAASDVTGTIAMCPYGQGSDETANFGVTAAGNGTAGVSARCFEVPGRALDDILDELGVARVDLLKMDIEGGEGRALAGLERHLVHGAVDRIILELHPAYLTALGDSADALVTSLGACGFDGWQIDHRPAAHRRAAASDQPIDGLLTPLGSAELGEWPHVLWARRGLGQPW